jgi:hypothetical protein
MMKGRNQIQSPIRRFVKLVTDQTSTSFKEQVRSDEVASVASLEGRDRDGFDLEKPTSPEFKCPNRPQPLNTPTTRYKDMWFLRVTQPFSQNVSSIHDPASSPGVGSERPGRPS